MSSSTRKALLPSAATWNHAAITGNSSPSYGAQRRQTLRLAGMTDATIEELERKQQLSGSVEIRAPIKGVIMEQMAVAGQRVEAATPLNRVAQLDPLWLEIHVPLNRAREIMLDDAVRIADSDAKGRIITIGSEVHPADQGILLRAEMAQGAGSLRPGQFVQAIVLCNCESANSYAAPAPFRHCPHGPANAGFIQVDDGFVAAKSRLNRNQRIHHRYR
ncbi:MAG: efflux RND transporter periplasmic adaptor subunit [Gammaproteobacteria bacterium]|nr:efflux RND transporter periplasmic adaptor subunit [Gammaproteobacteria bacterium]